MRNDIKEQWIGRLRSGEIPQGKAALNVNGEMCCLGVLCQIAADEGIVNADVNAQGYVAYDGEYMVLPLKVAEWSGIFSGNSYVSAIYGNPSILPVAVPIEGSDETTDVHSLAEANDGGLSFDEIADIIEREL